jgi:glycosyltransferase involved in cell wall biosynthesis
MPFYGNPDHFKIAVESVRSQTDPKWNLTVLDDNYPDEAPGQWLEGLADSRITYIRNSVNLMPSRNYNKALDLCSDEFIMLMGCDDVMLPGFITQIKKLIAEASPEVGIIQPAVQVIDENGKPHLGIADVMKKNIGTWPLSGTAEIAGKQAHLGLLKGNWTYFPSLIWRKSAIGELRFRTDLNVVQDLSMILLLLENGNSILVDSQPIFQYRRHRKSLSGKTGEDGSKFIQEQILFSEVALRSTNMGWIDNAKVAKRHIFSRLNAATELPRALIKFNTTGIKALLHHILAS